MEEKRECMSWVWLDGVRNFEKGKSVKAWKGWKSSFPMPFLIEMVAQAGGLLLGAESNYDEDIVFTKVEGVEFIRRPEAGELEIEVEPESIRREGGWFVGRVFQNGIKIMQGRILLMNVVLLRPDGKGPITFPQQLISGLKLKAALA